MKYQNLVFSFLIYVIILLFYLHIWQSNALYEQKLYCIGKLRSFMYEHSTYIHRNYDELHPPGMQRHSDVTFWFHVGCNMADHIEMSSQPRYWYVKRRTCLGLCCDISLAPK